MKKSILAVVVLATGVFSAHAQTGNKSGEVTANINLHKLQTLTINDQSVDIDFMTEDHYRTGASSEVLNDHMTISSTGAFVVNATAVHAVPNNGKSLGVATSPLSITTSQGSANALDAQAQYVSNKALVRGTTVVSSAVGQFGKTVDVQYSANTDAYINMNLIDRKFVTDDESTNVYQVQVTYTIAVK